MCAGHMQSAMEFVNVMYARTAAMDWCASDQAFAMQPGSPRIPCIHSMHGVGCRLPVNELLTTGTLSPVANVVWVCSHDIMQRVADVRSMMH